MQRLAPIAAVRETQWVEVAVTSAWGGDGAAFGNTTDSICVTLRNIGAHPFEYRVGAGPWTRLDLRNSILIDENLASTTIRLRKVEFGGDSTARFEIESLTSEYVADGHPVDLGGDEGGSVFGPSGELVLPESDEGQYDQVLASGGPGDAAWWRTLPPFPVSGRATLVAGSKLVFADVTALSVIQLTAQSLGTVEAPVPLYVSARAVGQSFTITSADPTDTSIIGWTMTEPTP